MNGGDTTDAQDPRVATTRRAFLGAAGTAGASALAGCGGAFAGFDDQSLIVGYQPFYTQSWSAVVLRHGDMLGKHLPDGYDVAQWEVALQGAVIGNKMISEQNVIGYTGDMPTITAIVNEETPISVPAIAGYSEGQQCNLCIVPEDSEFEDATDLDGREIGVTTGACTHRFLLEAIEAEEIDPQLVDQGINTILTNIRERNLPAGAGWEPAMSRAVAQEGEARYVFSGADYGLADLAGLLMLDWFVEDHPEAAKGWLKAELEAKHVMATDEERTLDLIQEEGQLRDYERETLRAALYESLDINPDVDRMKFYTDYEAVEGADELLKEEAPEFLADQGFIDRMPPEDRYRADVLHEAIEELDDEVDWDPRRAGGDG